MNEEPLWRKVLCWGSVTTFLTLPLFIFTLDLMGVFRGQFTHFAYLNQFYVTNTALLMGLAGLNSLQPLIVRTSRKGELTPAK